MLKIALLIAVVSFAASAFAIEPPVAPAAVYAAEATVATPATKVPEHAKPAYDLVINISGPVTMEQAIEFIDGLKKLSPNSLINSERATSGGINILIKK